MTRVIDRSRRLSRRASLLAFVVSAYVLAAASIAGAQPYPGGTPPPTVGGEKFFPDPAKTGVDVLALILLALVALLLGFVIRRLGRQARAGGS